MSSKTLPPLPNQTSKHLSAPPRAHELESLPPANSGEAAYIFGSVIPRRANRSAAARAGGGGGGEEKGEEEEEAEAQEEVVDMGVLHATVNQVANSGTTADKIGFLANSFETAAGLLKEVELRTGAADGRSVDQQAAAERLAHEYAAGTLGERDALAALVPLSLGLLVALQRLATRLADPPARLATGTRTGRLAAFSARELALGWDAAARQYGVRDAAVGHTLHEYVDNMHLQVLESMPRAVLDDPERPPPTAAQERALAAALFAGLDAELQGLVGKAGASQREFRANFIVAARTREFRRAQLREIAEVLKEAAEARRVADSAR